ncbi:MAG: glycosyltransferase family 1 protein [Chitinophagaceae bacterium]|nr:MAG: glycosyltransferase family 1 protein [Chitinophagaceae bacterium]
MTPRAMETQSNARQWSLLILGRHSPQAASSRLRTHQFRPYFEAEGAQVTYSPFFDEDYLHHLYTTRGRRLKHILAAYMRRAGALLGAKTYDLLLIEKELFPYLPGPFEQLAKLTGAPWVLDYDDAYFHAYNQHRSRLVRYVLGNKLDSLIGGANLVITGNSYLRDYMSQHGARRTILQPTVLDIQRYKVQPEPKVSPMRIGWIGTPETTKYLSIIFGTLARLNQVHPICLVTIGASPISDARFLIEQHPWTLESEADLLSTIHVGIMPLPDEPWERGKCGYKLIQYMACGRPVVASPVGMNVDLVRPAVGMLAANELEWYEALLSLCEDRNLCARMGRTGRRLVESDYSLQSVGPHFARLLADVATQRGILA